MSAAGRASAEPSRRDAGPGMEALGALACRTGTLLDYTICHQAPVGFTSPAPYAVGLIERPDGSRMLAPLVDCEPERLVAGMQVVLELRRVHRSAAGVVYGFKGVVQQAATAAAARPAPARETDESRT